MSVYNSANETAPSFAIMRLATDEDACMEDLDGQGVWVVGKPDADAEARQDPMMLFVNGPVPIPAGHYGIASQSWPVRCQLADANMAAGDTCGPSANSWTADANGTAFRLLSNDVIDDAASASLTLGWVSPSYAVTILPATLGANLTSGNSANATLLVGASRSSNGDTVVVYDLPTFITAGKQIVSGTKIRTYYDSVAEKFVLLTSAACESAVPT